MNLPNYEFLSAPLWLVTTLHVFTLSLHFVAMNCLLGGIIAVTFAALRGRSADPTLRSIAHLFPAGMAATVTLGVAPLLFLQLTYPRQAYAAAIVSAWFWLFIVAAVIAAYSALYRSDAVAERSGRIALPGLIVALAGMLYVSITYSSIFTLAEKPALIRELYAHNQTGLVWNPALGDYLLRWLHMIFGAITVGGFAVSLLGRHDAATFRLGKSFFLGGMILASLVGFAYLVVLMPILRAFMHTPAIWALTAAIVLSLGSLHFLFTKNFPVSGAMLFLSLVGMVYARHTVRLLKLAGTFDPATWRVAPQWGPFLLFLVCLVGAIGLLAYMFRLFFCGPDNTRATAPSA